MKKLIDKTIFVFSAVLVIYLPLQSLVENILQNKFLLSASYSYWISHFYEPLIVFLAFFAIVSFILTKPKPVLNFAAISFMLYTAALVLLASDPLSRGIEGFRIDSLPIIIFLLASVAQFEKKQFEVLSKIYMVVAAVVAIWAIVERLLPLNYWSEIGVGKFGYGQFGFGKFGFGALYQSASLIGWPNQLASYLLPAFFIALFQKRGAAKYLALVLFFTAIILAFSRAAWLGLAASFFDLHSVLSQK